MKPLGFSDVITTYQANYIAHKPGRVEHPRPNSEDLPQNDIRPVNRMAPLDMETLIPLRKDVYIPFDLFIRPKECVQTNPYMTPLKKSIETSVEKTREDRQIRKSIDLISQINLNAVPACIKDGNNGLTSHIYTTDWRQKCKIVQKFAFCGRSISDNKNFEVDNLVKLQSMLKTVQLQQSAPFPPLMPKLQKYADVWDSFQERALIDKDAIFWNKNRDKGLCSVCEGEKRNSLNSDCNKSG